MTERTGRRPPDTLLLDLRLRADDNAPSEARHATDGALGAVADGVRQSVLLIVTELVTNAVVHARSASSLRVLAGGGHVRVEVADSAREPPVVRSPSPRQPHGRGMLLISAMADEWGVRHTDDGKVVWAELRP
ncbi:ATP-binding protein [Prauserella flavalba]|uniref:ATP-binding protein n=1 Tax=Prauserella flavalba TaxID=1477506 RepID=UPI0036EDA880